MRLSPAGVAFLDRDGTINVKAEEGHYVERPEDLVLLPGAARAVRRLNEAGVPVVVVTNQRGIALGRMTEADLTAVHRRLAEALEEDAGAYVDEVLHCPHDRASCPCRKPEPGMLLDAARRRPGVDLAGSAMVGDAASDVEAGVRAGTMTVGLGSGHADADHRVDDLPGAVAWLLG